jgi:hypothetical protein
MVKQGDFHGKSSNPLDRCTHVFSSIVQLRQTAMNLSTCRHNSKSGDGKILFPKLQSWNPMTKVATIAADVDGKRVLCRITAEDLEKKFNASGEALMKAVTENRSQIENAARTLIQNGHYEADGSIIIRSKDL